MSVRVSVIVVSDYSSSPDAARHELRAVAEALAQQSFVGEVEHIFLVPSDREAAIAEEARAVLPGLLLLRSRARGSYAMKNEGVAAATAELVALLDADCVPTPIWIESFVRLLDRRPDIGVVSGRTSYPGRTLVERALAALSRSYIDQGRTARTDHVANNNAAYRRSVYRAYPLPEDRGPFASLEQSEAMGKAGVRLFFEPAMAVTHAFAGWPMERDIRRNLGWSVIHLRRKNRSLKWSWVVRLGYAAIPLFAVGRAVKSAWSCLRHRKAYQIRLCEIPIALGLALVVAALEVPGMIRAVRSLPVGPTSYR